MDPPAIDINGNIVFYFVFINELHTGHNLTYHSFSRQLTIRTLHPNYRYSCRVAAFTTTFGPFTSNVLVTTNEAGELLTLSQSVCHCMYIWWSLAMWVYYLSFAVPSASPSNFTLSQVTTFSASLSWKAPDFEQQNGRIKYYVIYLTDRTGNGGTVQIQSPTESWVLNNLRPAFCYSVSVSAYTVGTGPQTPNIQFCLLTAGR